MAVVTISVKELEAQLSALEAETRDKKKELRKQIAKQKRHEHDAFVKSVGKLAVETFSELHSEAEFKELFNSMRQV